MITGKKIAYVRVSTAEQNEARQLEAMKPYEVDKVFLEKASAKDTHRPKLQEMLDFVREDDTVYVKDFSRLARSTKDLLSLVELLDKKGVKLVSLKENIDSKTTSLTFFWKSDLNRVLLRMNMTKSRTLCVQNSIILKQD